MQHDPPQLTPQVLYEPFMEWSGVSWPDSPLCVPRTVLSSIEINFPGRGCKYWKTGFITTGDPGPEQTATHVRHTHLKKEMLQVSLTNEADAHALEREEGQPDVSRSQEANQEQRAGLG